MEGEPQQRPPRVSLGHRLTLCTGFLLPLAPNKKDATWRLFYLVREMGLEPTHHRYWLLRPARLPFRHSRREQPLSYHEKGPAVKSPATKEVWRWLCGGSTGISPPALRSNGHQPAFTCRFAILPTSPAVSGDHPVKTVTSLTFWNPSPA